MKKSVLAIIAIACLVAFWAPTDAQAFQLITRDMIEKEVVVITDLIKTTDNFIVLFDTSGSTNEMVPATEITKIAAAKSLLKERNAWMPNLGYQAGLYIYTPFEKISSTYKELYGVSNYDRDQFAAAIDQLPDEGKGPAMLQQGLHGLRNVLAGLTGKTVVFLFTDGMFTRVRGPKSPLQIAQDLAKEHDVCFYVISSAKADVEERLLEAVSKVNACSRVVPMEAFLDQPHYLSGALFTVKTTAYVRVQPVTQVVGFVTNPMLFDFASNAIRSEYNEKLDKLGNFLTNNPDAYVVAGGYTDSTGDEEYNLGLSARRADSLKDYLVGNFNIDANRIVTLWFGELNPAGDNATREGRRLNRRVEVVVGGVN